MNIAGMTFLDVETVPIRELKNVRGWDAYKLFLDRHWHKWQKKSEEEGWAEDNQELYESEFYVPETSLHAEFGKVVAISIGKLVNEKEGDKFYIRSLVDQDEKKLLEQTTISLAKAGGILCAHNGLEFDFPFLMRRYMINGLPIPPQLDVAETKPWDVKLRDTMKMWSGTQWNYKVSLELLCNILNVPSPKQEMDGSKVAELFSLGDEESMKKISDYCAGDVLACAQVYCRMKGLPLIENIEYV
jgi:predicted PolB exonuclease-like 3'-5' exonuclease